MQRSVCVCVRVCLSVCLEWPRTADCGSLNWTCVRTACIVNARGLQTTPCAAGMNSAAATWPGVAPAGLAHVFPTCTSPAIATWYYLQRQIHQQRAMLRAGATRP